MTSFNQLEVICSESHINTVLKFGRSPGLVVMGGDSHSKSHGFESQHRILDGHFFTYIFVVKICNVCLKRPKINEKEAGVGPFLKTLFLNLLLTLTSGLATHSHSLFLSG